MTRTSIRLSYIFASCVIALSMGAQPAFASSLESIFQSGNQAYAAGNLEQAIRAYQRLIKLGVDDADVYFNLGTAYAGMQRYGHAIRCFERADRLEPGDASITRSLRSALEALHARHALASPDTTIQTQPPLRYALLGQLRVNTLAVSILVFNVLVFGLLGARAFLRSSSQRLGLSVGSGVAAAALLVTVLLLLAKFGVLMQGRDAVVLEERASIIEAPSIKSRTRARALQGERAVVHERDGQFYRVTFVDGRKGWMHIEDVGVI